MDGTGSGAALSLFGGAFFANASACHLGSDESKVMEQGPCRPSIICGAARSAFVRGLI